MACPRLLAICLALSFCFPAQSFSAQSKDKIRVLCWSERTEPASVYPNGINGALVEMLAKDNEVVAKYANLSDPEQGLSEGALAKIDVLIWFGHEKHADVTQEHVDRVVQRVQAGMGFIALHSAHYSHPFQQMMAAIAAQKKAPLQGTPGSWGKVTDSGLPEHVHLLAPKHPILKGMKDFTIPRTETYFGPFNVPAPNVTLLDGNDGLLWTLGSGKIFYFRPGHETYPIYYQKEVRRILINAVHFVGARGAT